MGIEEGEEEFLERAAQAPAGGILQAFEASPHLRRPRVMRMALKERRDRDRAIDAEVFQLPERALGRRLASVRREHSVGAAVEAAQEAGRKYISVASKILGEAA